MRLLREVIYLEGYRPKPGSIFYSPSLDYKYKSIDAMIAFQESFKKGRAIFLNSEGFEIKMHPCKVKNCCKVDDEKPMCFRGTDWCCEIHRKIVMGELPAEEAADASSPSD